MFEKIFKDRIEAGRFLADKLMDYAGRRDVIVLGLPRGGIPVAYQVAQKLHAPLERLYRGARPLLEVRDLVVIVVDDGLATGSTMRAAVKALRQKDPKQIVVAAPVGARETCESFKDEVDVVCVCALTPEPFQAVGLWYVNFEQTTDDEVRHLLARALPGDQRKAAA